MNDGAKPHVEALRQMAERFAQYERECRELTAARRRLVPWWCRILNMTLRDVLRRARPAEGEEQEKP